MWLLSIIRIARRYRRRIFGASVPSWLEDLISLLAHVSLISVVPTLYMMAVHPKHFFKCVPAIVAKKKKYYSTPIKFAANLSVAQLLILKTVFPDVAHIANWQILVANAVMVLCAPLLLIILSLLLLIVTPPAVFIGFLRPSYLFSSSVRQMVRDMIRSYTSGFLIILDFRTYTTIDWQKYGWNLCFFYLYCYAAIMFVAGNLWLQVLFMQWDEICVSVMFAYFLLVRPYIFMLISSVRAATPEMEQFAMPIERPQVQGGREDISWWPVVLSILAGLIFWWIIW